MDIDDLFSETGVLSTSDVAHFFDVSETEARQWADELGVARIGASFAWVRENVEDLRDRLESDTEGDDDAESEDNSDEDE
jgi:hypothetical protein